MVCGNFILPEPASYVFFYAFFNLRNLLYIIGSFSMRMGSTTYIIGVHFSAESKDTLEDKMKRLMRDDVKADNF